MGNSKYDEFITGFGGGFVYNEKIKMAFIDEYTTSETLRRICVSVFDKFEPYEESWGSDLCTRNSEELQEPINLSAGNTEQSSKLPVYIIRRYIKWCINNHVPGAKEDGLHTRPSLLNKMFQSTVCNSKDLQAYLDAVFDEEGHGYTDDVYRCFLWLAFSGAFDKDVINISSKDVNQTRRTVNLGKYSVSLCVEAMRSLNSCLSLDKFASNSNSGVIRYFRRADGDKLLRRSRDEIPDIYGIRTVITKKAKAAYVSGRTTKILSYQRVWLSGLFCRKFEEESFGLDISFKPDIEWMISMDEHASDYQKSERNINSLSRNYMKDYLVWKETLIK